jgi:hypothetical protein
MTLHASELRKLLAQSNLTGFSTNEIKKNSCQALGIRVPGELPGGAKYLAQSLIPSTDFFQLKSNS